MSTALYFDHHVARPILVALRRRGVDVITAYEDGADRFADPELLDRAGQLGRVLVSADVDLLREAQRRDEAQEAYNGVIFGDQRLAWRLWIDDLEVCAMAGNPADFANRVQWLPL